MFAGGKKAAPARPGGKGAQGLSFIGSDVVLNGDVVSAAQIHIDGRIDGNVHCETLIQGEGGTIAGHIVADTAHLSGLVDGTVRARVITLEPSARVTGDVTYETLSISAGAAIEGRLSRKEGAPAAEPMLRAVEIAPAKKNPRKAEEPSLLPGISAAAVS